MSFKPDMGMKLMESGLGKESRLSFHDFPLHRIYVLGKNSYTAVANLPWEGHVYALSIDFNNKTLVKMLAHSPSKKNELLRASKSTGHFDLDEPISVSVSGHFGDLVITLKQVFRPFIVEEVI